MGLKEKKRKKILEKFLSCTLDVDARANVGLTGAVDGCARVVANVQLMEGLYGQHGVELVKVDYFDGRNLKIR